MFNEQEDKIQVAPKTPFWHFHFWDLAFWTQHHTYEQCRCGGRRVRNFRKDQPTTAGVDIEWLARGMKVSS